MTIDIIDLTDEAYSDLNAVQMSMVRDAQRKKDKILEETRLRKEEYLSILVSNDMAHNSFYALTRARLDAEAQDEIDAVRDDLEYQLAYEALGSEGDENGPYRYPENPNYNLTPSQRFLVVRNYYMQSTEDPDVRLASYAMDTLARQYLGEFYITLYDLLAAYCL